MDTPQPLTHTFTDLPVATDHNWSILIGAGDEVSALAKIYSVRMSRGVNENGMAAVRAIFPYFVYWADYRRAKSNLSRFITLPHVLTSKFTGASDRRGNSVFRRKRDIINRIHWETSEVPKWI